MKDHLSQSKGVAGETPDSVSTAPATQNLIPPATSNRRGSALKLRAWIEWHDDEQGKRVGKMVQAQYRTFKRDAGFLISDDMVQHLDIESSQATISWLKWTGLQDRNSKDIYEGDILKHDDGNWRGGGPYDKTHDGYFYTPVPSIREMIGDSDWNKDSVCNWEIVGNIWEHSQLLSDGRQGGKA